MIAVHHLASYSQPDAGASFSLMEKHRTANLEHAYFD
jgi:hypothetical protein